MCYNGILRLAGVSYIVTLQKREITMKGFIAVSALALVLAFAIGRIDAQEAKEKSQQPRISMGMMWSGTGDGKGAKCPGMAGTGMGGAMKAMMGLAPRKGGRQGMRQMQPAAQGAEKQ